MIDHIEDVVQLLLDVVEHFFGLFLAFLDHHFAMLFISEGILDY